MNVRHLRAEDLRGRRWRGLVRESTERQADQWSPARQRNDLIRAADELGLVGVEPLFYERTGSGEAVGVSELANAIADARAKQYDVLLVLHTSRFARNRAEAVRVKAEAKKIGLVVYFVAQRIVSGSLSGALSEGISEVIDENENEQRRFWVAGGIRERQLSGRWFGHTPYGYRRLLVDFPDGTRGWDGGLEVDPAEGPIVARIFREYVDGVLPRDIAHRLNTDGHRGRFGPWSRASIYKMLTNPAYTGRLIRYRSVTPDSHYYPEQDAENGRRDLEGSWQPLVTYPIWDAAQAIARGRSGGRNVGVRTRYPLSGVMRCGRCGGRMSGAYGGTKRRPARYYRCATRAASGLCDASAVRADAMEEQFAAFLSDMVLPDDWREQIARVPVLEDRAVDDQRRAALTAQLDRLKKLYQWGDCSETHYRGEKARILGEMSTIVRVNVPSIEAAAGALLDTGLNWSRLSQVDRAVMPSRLLDSVVYEAGEPIEWVVRGELRPLYDLMYERGLEPGNRDGATRSYRLRFSA